MINKKIYVFWFGPKMSLDRKKCLKSIITNSGVDVELITEKNLHKYIKEPLHKSFKFLSATHKSDYLRPYFMKTYGGCYMDIKYLDYNINPYFEILENSNADFIGYKEEEPGYWLAEWENRDKIAGAARYIFKKNTEFANIWLLRIHEYLDSIHDRLTLNPGTYHHRAIPGGIKDDEVLGTVFDEEKYKSYPHPWNIAGKIFQEVMRENTDRYILGIKYIPIHDPHFVKYR